MNSFPHFLRKDAHSGKVFRRQMGSELSRNHHLIQHGRIQSVVLQKDFDAGANRPFCQLNLANILLGNIHWDRVLLKAYAARTVLRIHLQIFFSFVPLRQPVRMHKGTAFSENTTPQEFFNPGKDAASADSLRRTASNDLQVNPIRPYFHIFNGSGLASHPLLDVHSLQGRPGSTGAGVYFTVSSQNNFAVGSDIHKEYVAGKVLQPAYVRTGDDIPANIGGYRRNAIQLRSFRLQTDFSGEASLRSL